MKDISDSSDNGRNIWMRGLFMLLMGFAFQVCGTILCIVAVVQFVIVLVNDDANPRLAAFGRSMGIYFQQIVCFLTFETEEVPFPFSEWPEGE